MCDCTSAESSDFLAFSKAESSPRLASSPSSGWRASIAAWLSVTALYASSSVVRDALSCATAAWTSSSCASAISPIAVSRRFLCEPARVRVPCA